MNQFKFLLIGLALLAGFTSCEDEDDTPDTEGLLSLSFDYKVDGEDFAYDNIYDINGTAVSFQFAQFYVHGITFMPENGDPVKAEGTYLLVKPEQKEYEIMEVEKGHYHMLSFNIGVSAEDNDQTEEDFTQRPADDPLSLQTPEPMHWNWNAGYIFFKINATADTDGDGTPDANMEYHIGTNNMLRSLQLIVHKDAMDEENTIELELDMEKLFTGLDLSKEFTSHTGDFPDRAVIFADNLASAFSKK